ncbi:MAG TPA: AgmX/PglI C-terminal domain-containing protein [Polyangiaceae bacterium]|nr:AgmX/PglI C-terminal domain-containing protein [Polyangiaceae bacterium]
MSFSVAACGAGQATSDGAKVAAPAEPGAPAVGVAVDGEAPPGSQGPTTTTALGDAGPAVKLPETPPSEATGAAAAPKGVHSHDPGRGPQDIRAIVVAHRDEARACYDRALKDHPGIEGDLVIQWTIDPKGSVTQVGIDTSRSQITEATVSACISDIIRRLKFAESAGGFETKAFYPFNFHPRHGQPSGSP